MRETIKTPISIHSIINQGEKSKNAIKKKVRLELEDRIKKTKVRNAKLNTHSVMLAASAISHIVGREHVDHLSMMDSVHEKVEQTLTGDTDNMASILLSNVFTLNALFNNMLVAATGQADPQNMGLYLDMAFKAQNQARKTILALNTMQHPRPQIFVAQQNIAGIQQVNNGQVLPNSNKNIKSENELLTSEERHETLDARRTIQASTINPAMEAMDAFNGRKNGSGQKRKPDERL